jgi:hypothetical protein
MKKKNAKRKTRMKIQTKIAAAATNDKSAALAYALYGRDGKAVAERLANREGETKLQSFIQWCLFIGNSRNDPWSKEQRRADPAPFTLKQEHLEIEMVQLFGGRIEDGDWKFFENFAKTLKAEVNFRDAGYLKNRDEIATKLLAANLSEEKADLSKMADELAQKEYPFDKDKREAKRKNIYLTLTRTAERIGAKTVSAKPGRPRSK